jgi:predicted ribonuclease YlaK
MHSVYVSLEVTPPLHQRGVPVAPLTLIWKQKMAAQKNKEINSKDLVVIKPITDNQKVIFDTWKKGQNQFLFGAAGTGKTFVSLYLALQDVMDLKKPYDKVILVRSLIPTREIGFLPGDEEDKSALYQVPYQNMVQFMFKMPNETSFNSLYPKLKAQSSLYFLSTSFLRGLTFDNSIIIVDECQNLNFHELDTIITRIGQDSKIIFCGDFAQSDLQRTNEKNGLHDFLRILEEMKEFNCTEFTIGDIVRSGFVRSYLINKTKMGIGME